MDLFCLPHAGASASIYYSWRKYLDPNIKICPLELKGRGSRFTENFYKDFSSLIEDLYLQLINNIGEKKYALFGHSFGSVICYELYQKLYENNNKLPAHIFFSGQETPEFIGRKEDYYLKNKTEEEIFKEIINMGGIPNEILNCKEMLEIVIPIIKNDLYLLDNYKYRCNRPKIQTSISVLYGSEEEINKQIICDWNNYTEKICHYIKINGNHFYTINNIKEVTDYINFFLKNYKLAE